MSRNSHSKFSGGYSIYYEDNRAFVSEALKNTATIVDINSRLAVCRASSTLLAYDELRKHCDVWSRLLWSANSWYS